MIYSFALLAFAIQNPVTLPAPTPGGQQTTTQTTVSAPAPVVPQTFVSEELGLAFDYPKTWKKAKVRVKNDDKFVITDPKTWRPAKTDLTTQFLMPLPGTDERGIVSIYSDIYNQDQDTWQTIQKDINDRPNRQILRQWTEEILGVPLLMTKIESKEKGLDLITETGLMYSATPRKFIFRLSASPDNFDKADYQFRQALLSLRTTDGRLPSAEDPNRKATAADLTPGAYHKVIWTPKDPPQLPVIKGEPLTQATSGGKAVVLRGPAGWKITKNADGTFTLSGVELSGTARLIVASDLDSDSAGNALTRTSGVALQAFQKVAKREEKTFVNRGQAGVGWIFRRGLGNDSKPLYCFDATGLNGDDYWLFSWSSTNQASIAKDRKALESLVDVLHIEPAP